VASSAQQGEHSPTLISLWLYYFRYYTECRRLGAENIAGMLMFGKTLLARRALLTVLEGFYHDPHPAVRKTIGQQLHKVSID